MRAGEIVGGKYRLTREIGQGSMGSVWAAVHELLGREVAIKFLSRSFEDERTSAARFVGEAKAAAQVKHRFVVDVFDFGITEGGDSYMVQELLSGEPLSDVFYYGPSWPLSEAVRFMEDCLSGLSAVHARGIVHRDLKPENIFVVREGDARFPKLLDFGISKATDAPHSRSAPRPSIRAPSKKRLTAAGATLGTPAYMSPEQLRNLSTLDARADIYSIGVVFYEWLVGHCPFATTANFAELLDRIVARDMTPLDALREDIGPELAAVIARAIEPDRAHRFASALEMRAALDKVRSALPIASTVLQQCVAESHAQVQPKLEVEVHSLPPISLPKPAKLPTWTASDVPPKLTMRTPDSMGIDSLRPMGLRRGPSPALWIGAAVVLVGVGLLVPLSMRATSHAGEPVRSEPVAAGPRDAKPAGATAPLPSPPGAPAQAQSAQLLPSEDHDALPTGEEPPEEPDVSPPGVKSEAAEAPRNRARIAAPTAPRRVDEPSPRTAAAAGAQAKEPATPPPPENPPTPSPKARDELVRSLDF
jgi:serine/threonine protein kinase